MNKSLYEDLIKVLSPGNVIYGTSVAQHVRAKHSEIEEINIWTQHPVWPSNGNYHAYDACFEEVTGPQAKKINEFLTKKGIAFKQTTDLQRVLFSIENSPSSEGFKIELDCDQYNCNLSGALEPIISNEALYINHNGIIDSYSDSFPISSIEEIKKGFFRMLDENSENSLEAYRLAIKAGFSEYKETDKTPQSKEEETMSDQQSFGQYALDTGKNLGIYMGATNIAVKNARDLLLKILDKKLAEKSTTKKSKKEKADFAKSRTEIHEMARKFLASDAGIIFLQMFISMSIFYGKNLASAVGGDNNFVTQFLDNPKVQKIGQTALAQAEAKGMEIAFSEIQELVMPIIGQFMTVLNSIPDHTIVNSTKTPPKKRVAVLAESEAPEEEEEENVKPERKRNRSN